MSYSRIYFSVDLQIFLLTVLDKHLYLNSCVSTQELNRYLIYKVVFHSLKCIMGIILLSLVLLQLNPGPCLSFPWTNTDWSWHSILKQLGPEFLQMVQPEFGHEISSSCLPVQSLHGSPKQCVRNRCQQVGTLLVLLILIGTPIIFFNERVRVIL